jgi:hypothetical protein
MDLDRAHSGSQRYKEFSLQLKNRLNKLGCLSPASTSDLVYCKGGGQSLHYGGEHERCFTRVGSSLTQERNSRLEETAGDKHSSLIGQFVSYEEKRFIKLPPRGLYYKTFYGRNLRILVIS